MVRKVIFDCDPGVDDALAISALFKAEDFEVLGICAVGGNRPLEYVYKNALKLVNFFNADTMVYKGVAPLEIMEVKASSFHGESGFGACEMAYDETHLSDKSAIEFMHEQLDKYPNEVEIIALGPVSNLATLALEYPNSFAKIKAIYSMGGSYEMGNITKDCEFNYFFDLKALEVLRDALEANPQVAFHMFPLNVTVKAAFDMNEFMFLKYEGGKWGEAIWDMFMSDYAPKSYGALGKTVCVLHDLVAAMYPLMPEIYDDVTKESFYLSKDCETFGKMIKCEGNASIYVHYDVDGDKMKKKYIELLYGEKLAVKYDQFVELMKH